MFNAYDSRSGIINFLIDSTLLTFLWGLETSFSDTTCTENIKCTKLLRIQIDIKAQILITGIGNLFIQC